MLKSIIIAVIGFILIIGVLLNSDAVHLPLLVIMLVALAIGFVNPTKGWLVAISLAISLLSFKLYFEKSDLPTTNRQIVNFICTISALPILFGGFMGRYFKKALK